MNLRTAQKARTRTAILNAAAMLFAERGFTGASTADIAAAAGISHGLVFAHFATREALVEAVIVRFGEETGKRLHEAVEKQLSLPGILAAHLRCIGENELFYSRLIAEISFLPGTARQTLVGLQSVISHHLYEVAKREMREGRIKNVQNDLLFNTWLGLVHYYLLNRDFFTPTGSVVETFGKKLCDHFIRFISTSKKEDHHVHE